MASKLTKPLTREVDAGRYGTIIIELTTVGITTRLKGRRMRYGPQSYSLLHERGMILTAKAAAAAKAPRKAGRGKLKVAG